MKHSGGVPPVFRKEKPNLVSPVVIEQRLKEVEKIRQPLPRQKEKTGLTQLFNKSRSPFSGPGPSTAGRRIKRKKTHKRKH